MHGPRNTLGTLPRHVPLQSVDITVRCHFRVLRHQLRRLCTLAIKLYENRERLAWAPLLVSAQSEVFFIFLFFRFFDLPVRRSIPARNFDPLRGACRNFSPGNPSDCAPSLSVCNYSVGRHIYIVYLRGPSGSRVLWLTFLLKDVFRNSG